MSSTSYDAQNQTRKAVLRKRPYVFDGTIGTAQIKPFESLYYTSLFIANNSVNTVYFDIGGSGFVSVLPNQQIVLDHVCRANDFTVYASGAGTAVTIMLWNAEG